MPSTPPPHATPPPGEAARPAVARPDRISAGLVLLLSALTAVGPLTIDLYLSAFPEIVAERAPPSRAFS